MGSRIIILAIALLSIKGLSAQDKKHYTNADEIKKTAISILDREMTTEDGKLLKFKEKNAVTGMYNFDITINDKGHVKSVFIVDREGGSEGLQNLLKDEVLKLKMGFKTPKGKRYKFNYKFKF